MITVQVVTKSVSAVLERVNGFLTRSPRLMRERTRQRVAQTKQDILRAVRTEPPPPHSPVDWQTPKQMRAYFATNGFGGGIPSRRSGKLLASYDVVVLDEREDSAVLVLVNEDPKARYVVGQDQQRQHARTGWGRIDTLAEQISTEQAGIAVDTWYRLADEL